MTEIPHRRAAGSPSSCSPPVRSRWCSPGSRPHAYGTWLLEVPAALIAAPILILTYRRFSLTPLAYRLILAQALILMIGGHWTYAEVPAGEWVAMCGAVLSQVVFARTHDRQLRGLHRSPSGR